MNRFFILIKGIVLSLGVFTICGCLSDTPSGEQPRKNKALIMDYYEGIWNKGELDRIDELFSEDFLDQSPAPNQKPDLAGFKLIIVGVYAGWSEPSFEIEELLAEEDKVSARWTFSAIFKPSGKEVTYGGIETWQIKEGKIFRRWGTLDMASHLAQRGLLGQVPMPPLPDPVPGVAPTEEDVETVRLYYEEIWNKRDFDLSETLFAADFVDHSPDAGQRPDLEGFFQSIHGYLAGFPDARFTIDGLKIEGDKIRANWTSEGTFTPTGTKVKFEGIEVWRVADGRIKERWGEYDQHAFTAPFR